MSCSCNSCDPDHEPLPSTVDNFVTQFFGEVTKTCVDGQIVWELPCNLDEGIPGYPRLPNEGLACYFSRVLEDISMGGGGGGGGGGPVDALLRSNNLSDLTNVPTARTNLGLGTMAVQNASNVNITGGTITNAQIINPVITGLTLNGATLVAPIISGAVLSTSTFNGGTLVSPTISGATITTPSVAGGTISAATISGSTLTGATISSGTIGALPITGASISGGTITGASVKALPAPVLPDDAATKAYADAAASGLSILSPVRTATTGSNITLAGGAPDTLDTLPLVIGDRILVKDQTNAIQNGVYEVQTVGTGSNGTWVRTTDADTTGELVTGTYVYVNSGSANASSSYVITTTGTITIGTTPITWTKYFSVGAISFSSITGTIVAGQIGSVNAGTIIGSITAGQIGSVNAGSITGSISAGQIGSVNANSITGVIAASQIGSVNASVIQGAITASQISSINASAIIGAISASQITSVNASSILGLINSTQIGSVSATTIVGGITASQINNVNATTIVGAISAGQIGSVSATSITGVIVGAQLTDQILNTQRLIASDISVVRRLSTLPSLPDANYPLGALVLNTTNKTLYQNVANSWSLVTSSSAVTGTLTANDIASVNASSITGLIIASQISSVSASSITGTIQASQIGSISATSITGTLNASQIATVNASSLVGGISSTQITSVDATTITGGITASQITSVNGSAITGGISATTITGGITASQITSVNASAITGSIAATQIGSVNATSIAGQINSSQIQSVNAGTITVGTLVDSQIATVGAGKIISGTIAAQEIVLSNSLSSILRSDNYVAGTSGWQIRGNGDGEFNNITVRGLLAASQIDHACLFIRPPSGNEGGQIFLEMPTGVLGNWAMDVDSNNDLRFFIEGNAPLAGVQSVKVYGDLQVLPDVSGGGDIYATNITISGFGYGDFTTFSSRQFKENDAPITGALDKVVQLVPVNFDWKSDSPFKAGQHDVGLIAEDVEKLFPQLVARDEQGRPAVNYAKLSVYLLAAIKELNAKL